MLPDFGEHGYLPPGVHPCALDEALTRFRHGSPERQVESTELEEFVAWAQQTDIRRVLLAGSYVTAKLAPNDVDMIVLPGKSYPVAETLSEQADHWPFLHIMIAADEADLEQWVRIDLGTDRNGVPRGLVEVLL